VWGAGCRVQGAGCRVQGVGCGEAGEGTWLRYRRASAALGRVGRALPTKTKVESGTSQSKSGTSVNLSNSGEPGCATFRLRRASAAAAVPVAGLMVWRFVVGRLSLHT